MEEPEFVVIFSVQVLPVMRGLPQRVQRLVGVVEEVFNKSILARME